MSVEDLTVKCPITGFDCDKPKNTLADPESTTPTICDSCDGMLPIIDLSLLKLQILAAKLHGLTPLQAHSCKGCDCTLSEIAHMGRMGCPQCYDSFIAFTEVMLKRSHLGNTTHTGKSPSSSVSHRLAKAELLLDAAIKEERFEDAAKYRDEMIKLKTERQQAQSSSALDS
jgi:protein arginine kinase activator